MIEIIALIILAGKIAAKAKAKGYVNTGKYRGMLVGFWFLGEFAGLAVGGLISQGNFAVMVFSASAARRSAHFWHSAGWRRCRSCPRPTWRRWNRPAGTRTWSTTGSLPLQRTGRGGPSAAGAGRWTRRAGCCTAPRGTSTATVSALGESPYNRPNTRMRRHETSHPGPRLN